MNGVRAFARAVILGSLAGAAPGLLFTVPFGLAVLVGDGSSGGLTIMIAPLIITAPFVLGASLLVGLPLTAVLTRLRKECGQYYVIAGLIVGTAPFLVWMQLANGANSIALLAMAGAFGGALTGWQWGRHRDELAGRDVGWDVSR